MRAPPAGTKREAQAMIRFVLWFVGLALLAVALGWLSYDFTRWIVGETRYVSIGTIWRNIPQSERAALQSAVEPLVDGWYGLIQPYFLNQPGSLGLATVGAILILIGRKKKPPIKSGKR